MKGVGAIKLYSTKAIARFLDITERRIRQLRDKKIIEEYSPGLYELIPTTHKYINYLRKQNPESEEQIDYNTERAKLIRAKRRNEEYELSLKEGELHCSEDIEVIMTDMLINFKARLMEIPAKLSPALCEKKDKTEIYKILKESIDEALKELSDFETVFGDRIKENEKDNN